MSYAVPMSYIPTATLNREINSKLAQAHTPRQPIDNKYFSHNPFVMNILQT
jgi:hypothetical protein